MKNINNSKYIWYIILSFILFTFFSCKPDNIQQNNVFKKPENVINTTEHSDIENIIYDIELNIANSFYDMDKSPVVKVHIKIPSSNYKEGLPLANYIYNEIKSHIKNKEQFAVVPSTDMDLDCIIETHVIKSDERSIYLLNVIKGSKYNNIIYALKCSLENIIQSERYLSYKKELIKNGVKFSLEKQTAHLLVKAVNISEKWDAFKTNTKTYSGTSFTDSSREANMRYGYNAKNTEGRIRGRGKVDAELRRESFDRTTRTRSQTEGLGTSAIYPLNQICYINGKVFKMNSEKIFFDDTIKSGKVIIDIYFQEGYWEATEKNREYLGWRHGYKTSSGNQTLGKIHNKKFVYDIKTGDNIKMEVHFICTNEEKDIKMKLYKEIEVDKGLFIEKYYEPILK